LNYILGVDQGGTKTVAAIADSQGRILGVSIGSGAYYPFDGIQYAMSVIHEVSLQAAERAGIPLRRIHLVVVGITGMDFPNQKGMLKSELQKALGIPEVVVVNDCIIAMLGGTTKSAGAVICAGTGLNIAVRADEDKEFILGDYIEDRLQGGGALAKRAVRKVFDSELGLCGPTQLTQLFLNRFHVQTVDDLLFFRGAEPDFYAKCRAMVPQIIDVAAKGDLVADGLLRQMAGEMTNCLICGMKKMGLMQGKLDVVLSGSVLKGPENPLTEYLETFILQSAPNATVISARYEPIVGACIMGLNRLEAMTPEVEEKLEQTATANQLIRMHS
jgi:N-acetylglucosamine kinase-like BadF-type ATPase